MEKASHILKQILLGGKLEDKLAGANLPLSDIEWDHAPLILPEEPGREGNLKPALVKSTEKNSFPKRNELKQESSRGKLLHFFANHELLAIETMAYTLLKFPDAPIEFKRGVMKTIQDEQRHMSLYLNRMHDYGVDLGGVPLNLYFWNILKTMQSPLDFVTRMSLTFEQANLDFALEYAELFEKEIADEKTAKLLRVVHDDEVKHVAHGLKWFNEWRNREKTEFESYQGLLPFPLTPRRGKGNGRFFAAQSRQEAGFSEDYILSMKVAGGSRGKVPDYFMFNPQCEMEDRITLTPGVKAKIADLAPLMLWLAQEDDVVELPRKPNLKWLTQIYDLKGELPEMVYVSPGETAKKGTEKYQIFEELKPWGWGESAWTRFTEIEKKFRSPPLFGREDHAKKFFSKAWWKRQLKEQNAKVFGSVVDSTELLAHWLAEVKNAHENARYLVKSAVSTSGRGHLEISQSMLSDPALIEKLKKRLEVEAIVIEPLLKKKIDFSIQYEILPNGEVKSEEPRFFLIDSHYQYRGALLGQWGAGTPYEAEFKLIREKIRFIKEEHQKAIRILKAHHYVGPLGIDCLIYHEGDSLEIAPLIEVNVRHTMGRVANEIEQALDRKGGQKRAFWTMINKSRLEPKDLDALFSHWLPTTPYEDARSTWSAVVWDHTILTQANLDQFITRC